MKVITRNFDLSGRGGEMRIVPLGDIHIGAGACDEKLLKRTIDRIANDENCYWIGMGDYCEFINVSDKRFDIRSLAKWVRLEHLTDIATAQTERFLDFVKPISHKCLALVAGNHEGFIASRYENAVYSRIVTEVKNMAGMPASDPLGVGMYGWLLLRFKRAGKNVTIKVNLHHGFVGGKLAGGKALNMQRWLWTHDCDLSLMGHSHNTSSQKEAVECVTGAGKSYMQKRVGAYCGTFLKSINEEGSSYSENFGYFPLAIGSIEVVLKPGSDDQNDRVKIIT